MARIKHQRREFAEAAEYADAALRSFEGAPLHMLDALITAIRIALDQHCTARAVALAERGLHTLHQFGGGGSARSSSGCASQRQSMPAETSSARIASSRDAAPGAPARCDIAEPSWHISYLTRNEACLRAQELAGTWGIKGCSAHPCISR